MLYLTVRNIKYTIRSLLPKRNFTKKWFLLEETQRAWVQWTTITLYSIGLDISNFTGKERMYICLDYKSAMWWGTWLRLAYVNSVSPFQSLPHDIHRLRQAEMPRDRASPNQPTNLNNFLDVWIDTSWTQRFNYRCALRDFPLWEVPRHICITRSLGAPPGPDS